MVDGINPVGMSYPMNAGMIQLPPLAPNAYAPPLNRPTVNPLITPDGRVMVPTPEPRGEQGVLDFVKDVGIGAVEGVTDMAKGVVFLAKGVVNIATHPIQTVKKVGGAISYAVHNPAAVGQTLIHIPGAIVHGIIHPYKEAWQNGEYGKVVGRLGVDVAMIYLTSKIGKGGGIGNGQVVMTDAGGAGIMDAGLGTGGGAGTVQQVIKQGTNVAKNIRVAPGAIKVGDVAAGATVNINIAGQQIAGSTLNAAGATAGAGGLGAGGLGTMGVNGMALAGSVTPEMAVQAVQSAKGLGVLGHTADVSAAARTISSYGLAANAKEVAAATRVLQNAGTATNYLEVAQALHNAQMGSLGLVNGMNMMNTMGRVGMPVMGRTFVNQFGQVVRPMVNGGFNTMANSMRVMPSVGMGIMDDVAGGLAGTVGAGVMPGVVGGALPTGAYIAADGTLRMAGGFERVLGGLGRAADFTGNVIGTTGRVAGKVVSGTLNGAGKVLSGIAHPFQTIRNGVNLITNPLTWTGWQQDLIVGANKAAVGLARGADWTGRALIYGAEHPAEAAAVIGLVGKGGQISHDGLQHLDLIR